MAGEGLQQMSVALYQYMCQQIVGSDETVKTKRLLMAIQDKLISDENCAYINSGSFGEGLEMKGSDFDNMFVLKHIVVHENQSSIKWHPKGTYFTVVTDDTKLGFVKLLLVYSQTDRYVNLCVEYKGKLYLSNRRIKFVFKIEAGRGAHEDYSTEHGPCLTDKDGLLDLAICIHMKSWINEAKRWVTRSNSSWPSDDLKSNIIKHGVLFVPIGVKYSPNEELEWRISFSVGEKLLINSFTHTQLLCYALMKICLKDIINEDKNCKDLLCSYFIKNILFWVSEESPISFWKPSNMLSCFMRCFERLIYCVEHLICPHYFIPENNMFENKIEGQSQNVLLKKLNAMYEQNWKLILYSPQLQDFQRIQCLRYNKTHKFISYFEQMNLSAVLSFARWLQKPNNKIINTCSSYISPRIKSYHHFCASMVNKNQACYVGFNEKDDNVQTYKDYNVCQSLLLQGINNDAVSGWLLLATLFYKTKQYKKALGILNHALSKCSQEKILMKSKLSDAQREILKSKTLQSTGLFIIFKFLLLNYVHFRFNATLIPRELELEVSQSGKMIPPVVYAHFLSFLCHFHLRDTRQAWNSIKDLQLTTSKEYFIHKSVFLKSCSYNCLGIALQMVGDKDLARLVFYKAIELDPVGLCSCARMRLSTCMIEGK